MTLKSKFIFWICLLFIFIGILIFVPLSIILPEKISYQILKRDIEIAQYLSREVQEPLLINNKLVLRMLLEDRLEDLKDVIYIYIRGCDGSVISSTFKKGFPRGLLDINPVTRPDGQAAINNHGRDRYRLKKFFADGQATYDIAIPLLKGELGSLHMGVSLESGKTEIAEFTRINYYVAIIIFIGLGVGILIFTLLGVFISNRIIKLKKFATRIGSGDLNDRLELKTRDEIGDLAASFNKMARDLKEKIETIKKLSYLEERDRIALEFHDGLAQNLADIIKRLELGEKLFKIEPAKAFEELNSLRENTRDILNKVRQVIFDLKSPDDHELDLSSKLMAYINDYERLLRGAVTVKLENSVAINNIPPAKAKSIFYIITEAFTNIKKHSQAQKVELIITSNGHNNLKINIKDDGRGFEVKDIEFARGDGKFGLISMRQRAASLGGTLVIHSKPNQGTEISVNIPLA